MHLDELARRLHALEDSDASLFQRRARVLQALWREEQGFQCGEHQGKGGPRLLGSRLPMPWAQETLANFITPRVQEVVLREVCDPVRSAGKLFAKPRIFNDLLSSQPLCFNLFGELCCDLELASGVVAELTGGRFIDVAAICFEHSPATSRSLRRNLAPDWLLYAPRHGLTARRAAAANLARSPAGGHYQKRRRLHGRPLRAAVPAE
jgi:hypothetical protein